MDAPNPEDEALMNECARCAAEFNVIAHGAWLSDDGRREMASVIYDAVIGALWVYRDRSLELRRRVPQPSNN